MYNCVNDNTRLYVQKKSDGNFLPETDFHNNVDEDPFDESDETDDITEYQLKGGMKDDKRKDPENYCREQLMLYTPWRNEQKDLIKDCKTYQERHNQVEEIVKSNNKDLNDDDYSAPVAPNTQHMNEQDIAAKTKAAELFECFDPGTNKQHSQYDLFQDINILLYSSY